MSQLNGIFIKCNTCGEGFYVSNCRVKKAKYCNAWCRQNRFKTKDYIKRYKKLNELAIEEKKCR